MKTKMNKRFMICFAILLSAITIHAQQIETGINIQQVVELGGIKQWIMIRGTDTTNPVLLFLHGGPGFPEMPFAYIDSKELEKHFIVVNWDQRGCGKSASQEILSESINMEQILSDTKELIDYLKTRFNKGKIFLIGHSWGSILGMYTIYNYPDDLYAYIGMGQVINSMDGEMISYQYAFNKAKEANDTISIQKLEKIGLPPYKGYENQSIQRAILAKYGGAFKQISYPDMIKMIYASPHYTQSDKSNFMSSFIQSNNLLEGSIMSINFSNTIKEVKVPVYFFLGRSDYGVPFELVEEYCQFLVAPKKEIIWFENSGHWHNLEEPQKYQEMLINKVLKTAS
jgi:pimeloyl-ACP methyl ester carboxylesterase